MTKDDFQTSAEQKDKAASGDKSGTVVALLPVKPQPAMRGPAPRAPAPRGFGPKAPFGMPTMPMMQATSIKLLPTLVHDAKKDTTAAGDQDE